MFVNKLNPTYEVLAACKRDEENYIILVDIRKEYVVCHYRAGESEWYWGHYFDHLSDAYDHWVAKCETRCLPYLKFVEPMAGSLDIIPIR